MLCLEKILLRFSDTQTTCGMTALLLSDVVGPFLSPLADLMTATRFKCFLKLCVHGTAVLWSLETLIILERTVGVCEAMVWW